MTTHTQTAHTPGPWAIETDSDTGELYVYGPDQEDPSNGEVYQALIHSAENNDPISKANARLIAAAPMMLEALKDMLMHEGERQYSGIGTEHDSDALEAAKAAAHAAIAAAEGRTEQEGR